MWARHLGVPHLWPSRVKVFFLGLLTSVFIFSVFQYLHNANVEYLDLRSPEEDAVVCKLPRPECSNASDVVACVVLIEDSSYWRGLNLSDPCPRLPSSLAEQTCRNPAVPLSAIMGDNGNLHTVHSEANPFKIWSLLFLVLTSLLSMSIVIHDLALLEDRLRPDILSLPQIRYAFPCLWEFLSLLQCRRRMCTVWEKNRTMWTLLFPFWMLFQVVAFMMIMYPFSLAFCFIAPIRMSRIMVFLSGILCMLWSVIFMTVTAVFDTQVYAVLWSVMEPGWETSCVCLCEYPLNKYVVLRIVGLGVGVLWHSLSLVLRALKGLRRQQWANMFSVLHAIPIEAFPIRWAVPPELGGDRGSNGDGSVVTVDSHGCRRHPIRWREAGEAVQTEPAFDPFCLMDEQPESGTMRCLIIPVRVDPQELAWNDEQRQHLVVDPYSATAGDNDEIGLCGFPLPPGRSASRGTSSGAEDQSNGLGSRTPGGRPGGSSHARSLSVPVGRRERGNFLSLGSGSLEELQLEPDDAAGVELQELSPLAAGGGPTTIGKRTKSGPTLSNTILGVRNGEAGASIGVRYPGKGVNRRPSGSTDVVDATPPSHGSQAASSRPRRWSPARRTKASGRETTQRGGGGAT
eukprot:TRINITY_DN112438_c0_g1_i1.p1 TRINITY_DN112438_c0_g1~~TRINITY_DN112438_c0_g1_i1.p1  ORF type:complete len:627 (+),score=87.73 TRINITY_DN112438_c0_g1_i1:92-1972(+)